MPANFIGWVSFLDPAYMLAVSIIGLCALPKSPFWAALILAPILIAGGYRIIT